MPSSNVVLDIDGPVATITLARTEAKNALTWEMYDALVEACDAVPGSGARVVIIRGSGGAFSAGTDIRQFDDVQERRRRHRLRTADRRRRRPRGGPRRADHRVGRRPGRGRRLRAWPWPAISGWRPMRPASGCRWRARSATACRSRTSRGWSTWWAPGRATEMMLTGRLVSADQALEWGLVTKVLPMAELETETLALALDLSRRATSTVDGHQGDAATAARPPASGVRAPATTCWRPATAAPSSAKAWRRLPHGACPRSADAGDVVAPRNIRHEGLEQQPAGDGADDRHRHAPRPAAG